MIQLIEDSSAHGHKFDKITRLLYGVCEFFMENIKIRIDIISEVYEILENAKRVVGRLCNFKEYLEADLNNGGHFYLNVVRTFATWVSFMTDDRRKK